MDKYMNANIVLSKFCRNYMELKREIPIRPSEMAVLNIITQRGGRYTPLMIAKLLGVSKSMIATHIQVLQKKGYIDKKPSVEDKRSFYVLPTDKATQLTDTFNAKQTEYLKEIEEEIGADEFNQLILLLDRILLTIEEMREE